MRHMKTKAIVGSMVHLAAYLLAPASCLLPSASRAAAKPRAAIAIVLGSEGKGDLEHFNSANAIGRTYHPFPVPCFRPCSPADH
jgi:hypothetical protein